VGSRQPGGAMVSEGQVGEDEAADDWLPVRAHEA